MAGFWAKMFVFLRAIPVAVGSTGHTASPEMMVLVVVALVNTVIAVFYYFRLVREMIFPDRALAVAPSALAPRRAPRSNSIAILFAIAFAVFGNFLLFPIWEVVEGTSSAQAVYRMATRMNIMYIGHENPLS